LVVLLRGMRWLRRHLSLLCLLLVKHGLLLLVNGGRVYHGRAVELCCNSLESETAISTHVSSVKRVIIQLVGVTALLGAGDSLC
jgi:hypothetical protein